MTKNYIHSSMFVGKLDKKKIFHLCFCINNNLTGWPFLDFQSNKKTKQEVEFPFFFLFFWKKSIFFSPKVVFQDFISTETHTKPQIFMDSQKLYFG